MKKYHINKLRELVGVSFEGVAKAINYKLDIKPLFKDDETLQNNPDCELIEKYLLRLLENQGKSDYLNEWVHVAFEEIADYKHKNKHKKLADRADVTLKRLMSWNVDRAPDIETQQRIRKVIDSAIQKDSGVVLLPEPLEYHISRERGDCGKVKYSSEQSARRAMSHHGARMRAYFCKECGAYHNTNQDKA